MTPNCMFLISFASGQLKPSPEKRKADYEGVNKELKLQKMEEGEEQDLDNLELLSEVSSKKERLPNDQENQVSIDSELVNY